jgi:glyoxylase-like metal-dependent hydrolase (beta-lactamase superfamily II)
MGERAVEAAEIVGDLWRWTGLVSSTGKAAASFFLKSGTIIVLVDPILPPEDEDGFWRALDRDVRQIGAAVHVVLTTPTHTRQTAAMLARYPESRLWTHRDASGEVEARGLEVTDVFEFGDVLPGDLETFPSGRSLESLLWLGEHRTLIAGDALAESGGRLELRPPEAAVAEALRAMPVQEVERVLPSHGAPVLGNAAGEIARLLGAYR